MHMCLMKATTPTTGAKWTKEEMSEYVRGYTHDAKQAWIRQGDYSRVVKRLSPCTVWKVQEVQEWPAGRIKVQVMQQQPSDGHKAAE